ncbi:MAG TPA: exosortase system-associated protein, TIGR04073 family [Candidatus Omnitrophota bacterium]|nr:exosortase system-associated protein, TIGR04073 family [Candidatus Omnitrophota bacterium]
MKRFTGILLILLLVISPFSAEAQTALDKLGRGAANTLTGFMALPNAMIRETEDNGAAAGITTGVVKGIIGIVVRELVGVYEIVTFPLPLPEDYRPILDDPEYLIQGIRIDSR